MKYLLSQEEYNELVNRGKRKEVKLKDILQDLCTKVADHMVLKEECSDDTKDEAEFKPWGCRITKRGGYCDHCPVQGVCPNENKEWSK